MPSIGGKTASTGVSSSTTIAEAMAAPTMAISPAGPWTHAQEDAVIEIAGSIKANRRAGVRRIVVVAIGADGLGTADADDNLRVSGRHQAQRGDKYCGAKQNLQSTHMEPLRRWLRLLECPGILRGPVFAHLSLPVEIALRYIDDHYREKGIQPGKHMAVGSCLGCIR